MTVCLVVLIAVTERYPEPAVAAGTKMSKKQREAYKKQVIDDRGSKIDYDYDRFYFKVVDIDRDGNKELICQTNHYGAMFQGKEQPDKVKCPIVNTDMGVYAWKNGRIKEIFRGYPCGGDFYTSVNLKKGLIVQRYSLGGEGNGITVYKYSKGERKKYLELDYRQRKNYKSNQYYQHYYLNGKRISQKKYQKVYDSYWDWDETPTTFYKATKKNITKYIEGKEYIKLNKSKSTVFLGKPLQLKITGSRKKVKWYSSNRKIATVSRSGKVTGKKTGKAVITVKVGKRELKCKITVENPNRLKDGDYRLVWSKKNGWGKIKGNKFMTKCAMEEIINDGNGYCSYKKIPATTRKLPISKNCQYGAVTGDRFSKKEFIETFLVKPFNYGFEISVKNGKIIRFTMSP